MDTPKLPLSNSQGMTIAVISNIIWTISNFRIDLIRELINKGYKVVCIADKDDFSDRSIALVKECGASFRKLRIFRKGINPLIDLVYFYRLYNILKSAKPDLVILYTIKPVIYGTLIARLLKIPSISVITGLGYVFIKNNFLSRLVKNFYRISLRHNCRVIFLNSDDQKEFVNENILNPSNTLILKGEGINTDIFKPLSDRCNDGCIRFLMMARLLWDKGVGEFVAAAKMIKEKYSNTEFKLLGFFDRGNPSAISEDQVAQWVKEGYIDYLGTSSNVKEIIDKADCVVLPSSYREGVPRSLMEAAAMGKAIITTDNAGCRDLIDESVNGFLCKMRNAADLADKMERFIKLPYETRLAMGEKGREKVIREFDVNIINTVYMDIILSILRRKKEKSFKLKQFLST